MDILTPKLESALRGDPLLAEAVLADPLLPNEINISLRSEQTAFFPRANAHCWHMLWVCCEGVGELLIDGTRYTLARNEAIMVMPGQPHQRVDTRAPHRWLLIQFTLLYQPRWLAEFRLRPLALPEAIRAELRTFADDYAAAVAAPHRGGANDCARRLSRIFDLMRDPAVSRLLPQMRPTGEVDDRLRSAYLLLMEHFSRTDAIEYAAARMELSPAYFRKRFQAHFAVTPYGFLKHYRLLMAKRMLLYSDRRIAEIGRRCGFRSPFAFCRFFSKAVGESPLAYRRSHLQRVIDTNYATGRG